MIPKFQAYDKKTRNLCPVTNISWTNKGKILQVEIQLPTGKEYRQPKNVELLIDCNCPQRSSRYDSF